MATARPTVRPCCVCGHLWPRDRAHYRRMARSPDGLHYECRGCHAERMRTYLHRPEVEARNRARARTEQDRARRAARAERYRARDPARAKKREHAKYQRRRAEVLFRLRLSAAIRAGRVARPSTCRACGEPPLRRLYAEIALNAPFSSARWYCERCYRRRRANPLACDPTTWARIHAAHVAALAAEASRLERLRVLKGERIAWLDHLYGDWPEPERDAKIARILEEEK